MLHLTCTATAYMCPTVSMVDCELAFKLHLQVSFSGAQRLWLVLPALLTHAHLWVRKAVLRLLCLGMSDPALGEPVSCSVQSMTILHCHLLHRVVSHALHRLTRAAALSYM